MLSAFRAYPNRFSAFVQLIKLVALRAIQFSVFSGIFAKGSRAQLAPTGTYRDFRLVLYMSYIFSTAFEKLLPYEHPPRCCEIVC